MRSVIVIPARIGSTRFPEKPFAMIAGKSMLQRVWEIAAATIADRVIIATDSEKIQQHAQSFGAECLMTSVECQSGTDRVAEVARSCHFTDEIVINLQGDTPLTPPWVIDSLIKEMFACADIELATPMIKLEGDRLIEVVRKKTAGSTSGTLVVFDKDKRALYFSKGLIPFSRSGDTSVPRYLHLGIYAYRVDALQRLNSLPVSRLESIEKLEQLRALENGMGIQMVEVDLLGRTLVSVDSPEDAVDAEAVIQREGEVVESKVL
ncbi:MAG: 3-deoxy-manno-octulosonate cytidylyltransferase [bacterium]|nr:3-deoxy-manno-octulosonate cytidylyltransferase [bacterium]